MVSHCVVHVKIYTALVNYAVEQHQRGRPVFGFDDPPAARGCQDPLPLEFIWQGYIRHRSDNFPAFVFENPPDAPARLQLAIQWIALPEVDPLVVALGLERTEPVAGFEQRNLLIVLEGSLAKLGTARGFLAGCGR